MVKGISKQVIVVHAQDPKLFEEAIFILNEEAVGEGVTQEALMKEAERAVRNGGRHPRRNGQLHSAVCALGGAAIASLLWVMITAV